jgi:hypothetical protein
VSIIGNAVWMVALAGPVLGITAWVVIDPIEAWPLTNAPMFAPDVGASTAIYRVHVELEDDTGARRPLPARMLGIPEWHFPRLLLTSAYGGMDDDAPFGFDDDTPERFKARMTRFLDVCVRYLAARNGLLGARRVLVSLERTKPAPVIRRTVATYDIESAVFTHVWSNR